MGATTTCLPAGNHNNHNNHNYHNNYNNYNNYNPSLRIFFIIFTTNKKWPEK